MHNIEKHPTYPGSYIGYTADGYGVTITRASKQSLWVGMRTDKDTSVCISARTLKELSVTLSETKVKKVQS